MDRLDAIRVFVAVAEEGSLSAAARRLGQPLATVSRKLAALEAALGSPLIGRTTRRLALNEPGRRYLEACRRLLADLDEAEAGLAGERGAPRGLLSVTAPVVFGRLHVVPVVADFLRAFPQVELRLTLADRIADLVEEQVDVAVRIGALADSALIATRVGATRPVVVAAPAYLAARGRPRRPEELGAYDCVTFTALDAPERWSFPAGRREKRIRVRSVLAVNTAEAALDAAAAGLGVTRLLSYQAAAAIADGRLRRILARFEPPAVAVSLLHREARFPSARLRAFLDFAAPRLRQRLAA